MGITGVSILVGLVGAVGGFANCLVADEFVPPQRDPKTRIWRPGWIGNVLVGGIAAILIWGLYGPCASIDIFWGDFKNISLTMGQLVSSLGVGFSGGRILTDFAGKQADRVLKENLVKALQNLTK
jgi:hypothetical protein